MRQLYSYEYYLINMYNYDLNTILNSNRTLVILSNRKLENKITKVTIRKFDKSTSNELAAVLI